MDNSKQKFDKLGYIVIPNLLPITDVTMILTDLYREIQNCANELGVEKEDYLKIVGRWHNSSAVTNCVPVSTIASVRSRLEEIFHEPLSLNRWNIIVKNQFFRGAIPCHQDISYSPKNPYYFSTWIPLHPIRNNSGGLKVLPNSHTQPLQPAIDFWSPNFKDHMQRSAEWKANAVSPQLNPGDCVVFHSHLWHGSDPNKSCTDRYALALRWDAKSFSPPVIPEFPSSEFGMLTCGKVTEDILRNSAPQKDMRANKFSRIQLIQLWIDNLEKFTSSDLMVIDQTKAKNALRQLEILERATLLHNGGDAEGSVYKTLWKVLLKPLQKYQRHA